MRQPVHARDRDAESGQGWVAAPRRDEAVFGETKAERTSRAIELEAKLNDACADFSMLESSVGTSVDAARVGERFYDERHVARDDGGRVVDGRRGSGC